jgi:hypothetical protein
VPTSGLWHVTLTVGGERQDAADVEGAMQRLSAERAFMLSGRYGATRAELRYWDEADDCADVCAMALRLWGEHRRTAGLPAWSVCGLEVLSREDYLRRDGAVLAEPGSWQPL